MREDSPDRYCPACKSDWLDEPIPEKDLHAFNAPPDELNCPDNWEVKYKRFIEEIKKGKYRDKPWFDTHFSRRMGIYDVKQDRTVGWRCPDCGDTT